MLEKAQDNQYDVYHLVLNTKYDIKHPCGY